MAKMIVVVWCLEIWLVYGCQRVECAFTSPLRIECGMFVMCCMQCCKSDMFNVVNMKFGVFIVECMLDVVNG